MNNNLQATQLSTNQLKLIRAFHYSTTDKASFIMLLRSEAIEQKLHKRPEWKQKDLEQILRSDENTSLEKISKIIEALNLTKFGVLEKANNLWEKSVTETSIDKNFLVSCIIENTKRRNSIISK